MIFHSLSPNYCAPRLFELEQALNEFSEKSIQEIKKDLQRYLNYKRGFVLENSDLLESLKMEIQNLSKTGFFLNPLHQLTYLKALGLAKEHGYPG